MPRPLDRDRLPEPEDPGNPIAVIQSIAPGGTRTHTSHPSLNLQPDAADRASARTGTGRRFADRDAHGLRLRTLTVGVGADGAVQFARSLRETDRTLARLRYLLALLPLVGTLFAAVIARGLARRLEVSRDALAESVAAQRQLVGEPPWAAGREARQP